MTAYEKVVDLAYGENPHQRAAYYAAGRARACTCSRWSRQHRAARSCRSTTCSTSTPGALLVSEFELPACAIIKHNNPCGCAVGGSALEAYQRAFACDPLSAFGGVVCFNRPVDGPLAEALLQQFAEV